MRRWEDKHLLAHVAKNVKSSLWLYMIVQVNSWAVGMAPVSTKSRTFTWCSLNINELQFMSHLATRMAWSSKTHTNINLNRSLSVLSPVLLFGVTGPPVHLCISRWPLQLRSTPLHLARHVPLVHPGCTGRSLQRLRWSVEGQSKTEPRLSSRRHLIGRDWKRSDKICSMWDCLPVEKNQSVAFIRWVAWCTLYRFHRRTSQRSKLIGWGTPTI